MKRAPRDFHKLAIIRREARGNTTAIPSKKRYIRHPKHKARCYVD
jgi:hypothetical protein